MRNVCALNLQNKAKVELVEVLQKSRFSCCHVVKPQNKNNENLESREMHVVIFCLIALHRFLILVSAVISNFILHVEYLLCYLQRFPRHSTLATALELVSDVMIVYYLYFNMFNEKC